MYIHISIVSYGLSCVCIHMHLNIGVLEKMLVPKKKLSFVYFLYFQVYCLFFIVYENFYVCVCVHISVILYAQIHRVNLHDFAQKACKFHFVVSFLIYYIDVFVSDHKKSRDCFLFLPKGGVWSNPKGLHHKNFECFRIFC